ncbi:DoxX family protein [Leptospira wolffii]|uniref:DoxX family protein n=1 Tax=Leptospira wolffii TaxID=409998 RepID=A0A2M9ZBH4_9LEPT|nr:DoxX family protein [Leptospira wolffii]PJZ65773.1 DoxX family protein [Leptospira wolffii]TGK56188.1 DoxX family protein [Leptospira wolffii]TGK72234.1 DoxX family protein [Leptospira wolffii]TGK72859.1 DoxX family protein [Leptospira wolffii]TGL27811.1 DoxX family protein [Leptospira wolffii]
MTSESIPKWQLWTGRILSGISIALLLFDGIIKFFLDSMGPEAKAAGAILAYPDSVLPWIGTTLIVCTLLYAFPKTSVFGAVLLTGYMGGAIASHVRVLNPWFSHILFPVYVSLFFWGGLYLRSPELRALFPWRK